MIPDRDCLDDQLDRLVDGLLDEIEAADAAWFAAQLQPAVERHLTLVPATVEVDRCGWCGAPYAGHGGRVDRREARYSRGAPRPGDRVAVRIRVDRLRAESWERCQGAIARHADRREA